MNPVALYDALNCASLAVLAAEGGERPRAEYAFLEAAVAASTAFPPSPLADALNLVLGAVGDMAAGRVA